MNSTRILSVGQCAYDHGSLARHLTGKFGASVAGADTIDDALAELRSEKYDLVLINRVLDADSSSGLDLIRTMKADRALAGVPVMLVSNFAEAQAEAVALGALRGFGKSELRDQKTLEMVGKALGATQS